MGCPGCSSGSFGLSMSSSMFVVRLSSPLPSINCLHSLLSSGSGTGGVIVCGLNCIPGSNCVYLSISAPDPELVPISLFPVWGRPVRGGPVPKSLSVELGFLCFASYPGIEVSLEWQFTLLFRWSILWFCFHSFYSGVRVPVNQDVRLCEEYLLGRDLCRAGIIEEGPIVSSLRYYCVMPVVFCVVM